ncbi:unnamed protein product [Vicia faba]|uniref:At3g05675-like ankyrin-like domain-containing protein n=1 Tax=Vicia faba TaxID=3906 RepID=A0AAV1AY58_VICFA|nr:unnamed protein product [Vicia faba]
MEPTDKEEKVVFVIDDRSTSDVVVRLRTQEGREEWMYCHSVILVKSCKYFADRLSENWPTCQILGSRNCVDVNCQESDFDYYVNVIRFLYIVDDDGLVDDLWHGVRNNLGILQVAVELDCPKIVAACVSYLEAMTWEESEEEEILKIVPRMGLQAEPILARLQPVDEIAVRNVFLSALRFVTSSPPLAMNDLKSSAQEQLDYMLSEDDDVPLLIADDKIKLEILSKLEIMRDFVECWFDASEKIVKVLEQESSATDIIEIKLRAVEITSKVLEAIAYGTVILPTAKRLQVLKQWLPFVRVTKPMIDSAMMNSENAVLPKMDSEMWQTLESSFVSVVLALPSGDQAVLLTEWLENEHMRYPDLTEAFEVWCYRSKVARRRLSVLEDDQVMTNSV